MKHKVYAVIGVAVAMISCAAPKAVVVAEAPVVKTEKLPDPAPAPDQTNLPVDDGLRMPDMLAMPQEGDFRSTNSAAAVAGGQSNAVIARPPLDPPSRTKPKAE
ncbi:MAG: hypothetical protein ACRCXD_17765 [Luteolibacter sp.]